MSIVNFISTILERTGTLDFAIASVYKKISSSRFASAASFSRGMKDPAEPPE